MHTPFTDDPQAFRVSVHLCRCCGRIAYNYTQLALMLNRPDMQFIECRTDGCKNWMVTQDTRDDVSHLFMPVSMHVNDLIEFVTVLDHFKE